MYTARRRKDAPAMWYARGAARLYINCAPLECQRGWDDDDDTVLSRGADRLRKYIRIYIRKRNTYAKFRVGRVPGYTGVCNPDSSVRIMSCG